jgi:hypothetical protein
MPLQPCQVTPDVLHSSFPVVKAGALTSRFGSGRPSETNSKERKSLSAGEQTPVDLRQDEMTPAPTNLPPLTERR